MLISHRILRWTNWNSLACCCSSQFNKFLYLAKDMFFPGKKAILFIHHATSLSDSSYCKRVFSSLGGSDLAAVLTEWYCSLSASSKQLLDTEAICPTPFCVISANEKWLVFLESHSRCRQQIFEFTITVEDDAEGACWWTFLGLLIPYSYIKLKLQITRQKHHNCWRLLFCTYF